MADPVERAWSGRSGLRYRAEDWCLLAFWIALMPTGLGPAVLLVNLVHEAGHALAACLSGHGITGGGLGPGTLGYALDWETGRPRVRVGSWVPHVSVPDRTIDSRWMPLIAASGVAAATLAAALAWAAGWIAPLAALSAVVQTVAAKAWPSWDQLFRLGFDLTFLAHTVAAGVLNLQPSRPGEPPTDGDYIFGARPTPVARPESADTGALQALLDAASTPVERPGA